MDERTKKRKKFLINSAYYAVCILLYYIAFKYAIYEIMPFFMALLIAIFLNSIISFIQKKTKLPRKGVSAAVLVIFFGLIVGLLVLAGTKLIIAALAWFGKLPSLYSQYAEPAIESVLEFYNEKITVLLPGDNVYIEQIQNTLISKASEAISYISGKLVNVAQRLAVGAPSTFIGLIFGVVASVFLTFDLPSVKYFFMNQFDEKEQDIIRDIKYYIVNNLGKIITSYGLIMLITFCELYVGLGFIGVSDYQLVAFLTALCDILPALGTGTVLIPWALISFINGSVQRGVCVLLLYLIITVVRNIIEPKIVGKSVGINPVLMLMCIFLGAKLFGAFGIIVLPFTVIVIKNLNDSGKIHFFKSAYMPEEKKEKKIFFSKNKK